MTFLMLFIHTLRICWGCNVQWCLKKRPGKMITKQQLMPMQLRCRCSQIPKSTTQDGEVFLQSTFIAFVIYEQEKKKMYPRTRCRKKKRLFYTLYSKPASRGLICMG